MKLRLALTTPGADCPIGAGLPGQSPRTPTHLAGLVGVLWKARLVPLRRLSIVLALLGIGGLTTLSAAEAEGGFSRTSVDVGLVVRDIEKSAEFYTAAIGFREIEGFSVPGALAGELGMSDGESLSVRLLVLGEDKSAARLKLIGAPSPEAAAAGRQQKTDAAAVSQLGFRYITVFVADIDRALRRIKEAGVEPGPKGPVRLGTDTRHEVFVMIVTDPDGNLIEIVGPRTGGGDDGRDE